MLRGEISLLKGLLHEAQPLIRIPPFSEIETGGKAKANMRNGMGTKPKLYSKRIAVLLNSVFGVCLSYTAIALWFALKSGFVVECSFVVGFSLYNLIWLASDIAYNIARYRKQGGGSSFWMSLLLPPVFIIILLAVVMALFF